VEKITQFRGQMLNLGEHNTVVSFTGLLFGVVIPVACKQT